MDRKPSRNQLLRKWLVSIPSFVLAGVIIGSLILGFVASSSTPSSSTSFSTPQTQPQGAEIVIVFSGTTSYTTTVPQGATICGTSKLYVFVQPELIIITADVNITTTTTFTAISC